MRRRPSARPPSARPRCTRWPDAARPGSSANRNGLVLAAAGVDNSNVEPGEVLLLPVDPDASAAALRDGHPGADRRPRRRRRVRHPRPRLADGPDRRGDRGGRRPGRRGLRRPARRVRQRPARDRRGAGRRARRRRRPGQDQARRPARRPGPRPGPPGRRRRGHGPRPGPRRRRRTCSATAPRRPCWRRCWARSTRPDRYEALLDLPPDERAAALLTGPGAPALEPAAAAFVERLLGVTLATAAAADRFVTRPAHSAAV